MKLFGKKDSAGLKDSLKAAASAQAHAVGDAARHGASAMKDAAGAHAKLVASDLWVALKTDWRMQVMMGVLVLSLVLWNVPAVSALIYPFRLFTIIVHEACHGLAARLTGGNITLIKIAEHAGGTYTYGGIEPIVVSAGYLGAALFGALLIWWGRKPETAKAVLQSTGVVIIVLTIFYGGGTLFSFLSMLAIGGILLLISRRASVKVCHMVLLVLAIQTTLQAFLQIQYLFFFQENSMGIMSDALHMEEVTHVPAAVWTVLWAIISMLLFLYAFWISYRPAKTAPAAVAPAAAVSPPDAPLAIEVKVNETADGSSIKVPVEEKEEA